MSTDLNALARDVAFLRDAVDRTGGTPAGIYFLWAGIVGAGAVVMGRAEWADRVGWYWSVASVLGVIGSAVVGWRHGARTGAASARRGIRTFLHWCGVTAAVFAAMVLVARGMLPVQAVSAVALLLVSLGYYLMGVHVDRWSYLPAVLALGAAATLVVFPGSWVLTGVACATGLTAMGVLELVRPRRMHV